MKVIDAIVKGFGVAGKNLNILLLLFAFNLVWNLVTLPFLGTVQPVETPADLTTLPPISPLIGLLSVIFILLNIFVQGGVLGVLKDAVASGGKAVLANFVNYGKKFYLRFLGLGLVILGILLLAALLIGLITGLSGVVNNPVVNAISIGIGIILGIAALCYMFLIYLSPYTLVVDDTSIFKAIGNSIRFIKTHIGKVLGLSVLLVLIGLGMGFIAGILSGLMTLVLKGVAGQIFTGIISSAVNAYLTVIISIALLAYYSTVSGIEKKEQQQPSPFNI